MSGDIILIIFVIPIKIINPINAINPIFEYFLIICACLSYKILIEEIEKIITTTTAITTKIDLFGNSFSENDEIVSRIKIPPIIVEFIIKISLDSITILAQFYIQYTYYKSKVIVLEVVIK